MELLRNVERGVTAVPCRRNKLELWFGRSRF